MPMVTGLVAQEPATRSWHESAAPTGGARTRIPRTSRPYGSPEIGKVTATVVGSQVKFGWTAVVMNSYPRAITCSLGVESASEDASAPSRSDIDTGNGSTFSSVKVARPPVLSLCTRRPVEHRHHVAHGELDRVSRSAWGDSLRPGSARNPSTGGGAFQDLRVVHEANRRGSDSALEHHRSAR